MSAGKWILGGLGFVLGGPIGAVIGVLIANIDLIMGQVILDPSQRAVVVALVMAILSPIMAALGEAGVQDGQS